MYRVRVKRLVLVMKGLLRFDLSSSRNGLLLAGGRAVETSPFLSSLNTLNKNTHSMYCGDCDTAIAKAAAAVTQVQSQSQEVGSGDEGLGLLCFDLSSKETDFWWLQDEQ